MTMDGDILRSILFGGFFAVVFGGVGFFLLVRLIMAFRLASQSQGWTSTMGQIKISKVQFKDNNGADSYPATSYLPNVEYSFTVMGLKYRGTRIAFGMDITGTRSKAEKIINRFPAGSAVVVYYDPNNPAESVLEQKVENKTGVLIMIIVFLFLGITACIYAGGAKFLYNPPG
jgi:hypothetical protein